ncbi:neither inactivation nor afterpotential protein C isoform X2 [Prorops nasuta]|uniref:neither inactivation nor afterpotential protein C isoform X2 n=1 Tax=Prorops nasuta TaxID=863751 RepID=UPI0034CDDAF0
MDDYDDYGRRHRREEDDEEEEARDSASGSSRLRRLDSIQDPGKRYILKRVIGSGVCGDVHEAVDQEAGNKKVAIKVQKLTRESQGLVIQEYKVLRDLSSHPNIAEFYGIYRRRSGKKSDHDQIWLVMELCEGGSVMDLVRGLMASNKKMREEHIAYILKEIIKALVHLHEHNVIHRDIRGNNIMLTKEGGVRLVDFGLSRNIEGEMGQRRTCIGSPSWMAPEVVMGKGYGARADVWAIGITAIELADGKPPFQDMNPTRALFQIVRNPPPGLYRPANWSQNFNDFIAECLEKNPDNRPFMSEIMEHPFLSELPENDYPLSQEIKSLAMDMRDKAKIEAKPEVIVQKGFLKIHQTDPLEPMFTEDLAALDMLTEDTILDELQERLRQGYYHTFIGDILLILHPNEKQDIYGMHYHAKYNCKSRSDNAPHIYSVADSAYQDVLHNEEPQHIILAGESNSGKTTNMMHALQHLMFLGKALQETGARVIKAVNVIHAFTNAATPLNPNSTRCVLQTQTTYGSTGKASGAIFWLYQLEKWRISTRDKNQSNFHALYYLYDGLEASNKLKTYFLPPGRRLRYLRISDKGTERKRSFKVRNDPNGNASKYDELKENLKSLEMEEHSETIWRVLAAIMLMGEIRFIEGNNGQADIDQSETTRRVAELLGLDSKKFSWSLLNYCLIRKGAAVRKRHTCDEAKEARDVLANTLYQRLVDWIVNNINHKLSVARTLFGDKYSISILDLFGFECFAVNRIEQLMVNTMNEQMQCHYNQTVFAWEMQEQEEEDIPVQQLHFYDNKEAIEQLMGKEHGLFHLLDDASRQLLDSRYILEKLKQRSPNIYVKPISSHEFTVAHYTGKLIYDGSEIAEKNRDFLPPEMIETLRLSTKKPIVEMFTNKLTKSGNLTIIVDQPTQQVEKKTTRSKWGAALMQENTKLRKFNTASKGQYSQTRKMRTCSMTFRSSSLEVLRHLSMAGGSSGTHFVRCIRADLEGTPRGFYREVVRQQIRALAVLDTAKARQRGYPHRISFHEFLRRYKFLAFDFDENVELTKDNCRLLLIRLKMEGWIIGKTKVFLKYYNEEYLSRLYETQVKKIIKVQCMMRAFLARKTMANKVTKVRKEVVKQASLKKQSQSIEMSQDQAALVLQKAYRGHVVRKEVSPRLKGEEMDEETKDMMRFYSSKWRSKSIFQVLLLYRAARFQDLVQFSQQVHLYNQAIVGALESTNERIPLERIDPGVKRSAYLGQLPPPQVHKLPFSFQHDLPCFDTSYMNDPSSGKRRSGDPSIPVRCPGPDDHRHAKINNRNKNIQQRPLNRNQQTANAHNPRSNHYGNAGSASYSKSHAPPPPPLTRTHNYNNALDNRASGSSSNVDNAYHAYDQEDGNRNANNRTNPIHELQMLGRKNNNNEDEDDPPFNFQAMLRKTHHQRASMKRTGIYDGHDVSSGSGDYYSRTRDDLYESNVIYRSNKKRPESPEWNPNEMVKMSEKYGKEGVWALEKQKSITTEIAPGITVEGYVAEL